MSRNSSQRTAFTLIEILIVVVIMSILAATIIPQFSTSTTDAKVNTLKFNLQSMRKQIELYKFQHPNALPTITGTSLPQLTSMTDANGNIGVGASFPLGPYISALPTNTLDNKNTVTATAVFPPTAATAAGGWLYNAATGQIAPNTAGHLTD